MNSITCDFLVIGSGLAGLSAALELADHGQVIIATKKEKTECNSRYAQGGIACVMDPNDSEQAHTEDTLFSGCGLTDATVTEQIIHQGKKRIRALESLGLSFDLRKGRETEYDLGQEGGHSHRRILHCGDITGGAIMQTLQTAIANKPNIQTLEHHIAIDLITTSWLHGSGKNQCVGAYFLNTESNEVFAIQARATLLATGGVGKVYPYTSNPDVATGDGLAMAWRAGLPIRNMEFIQFHPTCLYHPNAKSFLISEAVRGEGAQLIDKRGHAFMNEYDSRGSLATRDITARAIDAVMKKSGDPYVYLDITHHSAEFLKERVFPIYMLPAFNTVSIWQRILFRWYPLRTTHAAALLRASMVAPHWKDFSRLGSWRALVFMGLIVLQATHFSKPLCVVIMLEWLCKTPCNLPSYH